VSQLPGVPVQISVLQVNCMAYKMPTWALLLAAVERSLPASTTDKEEDEQVQIIQTLKDRLAKPSNTLEGEAFNTVNQFRVIYFHAQDPVPSDARHIKKPGGFIYSIGYHAEAVTAVLSRYHFKVNKWPGNGSAEDADSAEFGQICEVSSILLIPLSTSDYPHRV
jgi:hypothetical protein